MVFNKVFKCHYNFDFLGIKIDPINKKILYLLQNDARISYKEIVATLKRSETTIRDRIKAMERMEIIQGYTALIDKTALGLHFFAIILINPISTIDLDEVTEKIKKNQKRAESVSNLWASSTRFFHCVSSN